MIWKRTRRAERGASFSDAAGFELRAPRSVAWALAAAIGVVVAAPAVNAGGQAPTQDELPAGSPKKTPWVGEGFYRFTTETAVRFGREQQVGLPSRERSRGLELEEVPALGEWQGGTLGTQRIGLSYFKELFPMVEPLDWNWLPNEAMDVEFGVEATPTMGDRGFRSDFLQRRESELVAAFAILQVPLIRTHHATWDGALDLGFGLGLSTRHELQSSPWSLGARMPEDDEYFYRLEVAWKSDHYSRVGEGSKRFLSIEVPFSVASSNDRGFAHMSGWDWRLSPSATWTWMLNNRNPDPPATPDPSGILNYVGIGLVAQEREIAASLTLGSGFRGMGWKRRPASSSQPGEAWLPNLRYEVEFGGRRNWSQSSRTVYSATPRVRWTYDF